MAYLHDKTTYVITGIPVSLWKEFKVVAVRKNLTINKMLLELITKEVSN